jgi:hypothetical protein
VPQRGGCAIQVDYQKTPAEDFARATINYVDEDENALIVEVTTSWIMSVLVFV